MQDDKPIKPHESTVTLGKSDAPPAGKSERMTGVLHPKPPSKSPLPPTPESVEDYKILGELGRGGMGEVFLAHDPVLNRKIALKRVRSDRGDSADIRDRFLVEARVTAMLQHPSIIPVYSLSGTGDEVYYTMRPVEGKTLADILELVREKGAEVSEEWSVLRLVRLFLQATGAVAFAHSRGVIHRDLKPANIMIGPFDEVLVLDWGLAKIVDDEPEEAPAQKVDPGLLVEMDMNTASKIVIGTPGYIPWENLKDGLPGSMESDVFALGVILYELLALKSPWSGDTLETLVESMKGEPHHPTQLQPGREVPAALADVAIRAIHPDPERRYASVSDFSHDVARALEGRASWQPIEQPGSEPDWSLYAGRKSEEEEGTVLQSSGRNQEFVYVHARPFFTRDLRLEFEFALRKGRHALSVLLSRSDLRDRSELRGYTLGVISKRRRLLSLLRDGCDVAGGRSPEYEPKTWYHAAVEREGDHFVLRIDNEVVYSYTDPIPLRSGFVGILGESTGIRVRNVRLWSRGASPTVSCLAVPDAFFNHRLYEEARGEYLRIASSLVGRREARLAAFRAGLCYVEMARLEKDGDVREMLLWEAGESFRSLRGTSRSSLASLGSAIVAAENGQSQALRSALLDAFNNYEDDPHQNVAREWLLTYLHGIDPNSRHAMAECIPLAIDYCLDDTGLNVVRDLISNVRNDWEAPSFMTGRLQGKLADAVCRAESKLFFGFWGARTEDILDAADRLMSSVKFRPYHVTDTVFALIELGRIDEAMTVHKKLRSRQSEVFDGRFALARKFAGAALDAIGGDAAAAELALSEMDCEATDRGFNTARLAVARAEFAAGRHGQVFKALRNLGRHDSFAREHRAWFAVKMGDFDMAVRELAPLVERGSHERGRNLTNFLHGLCLLHEGEMQEANRVFGMLQLQRYPRTWTLGSHVASGRLSGKRFDRYVNESFPWERKHLYAQMALLSRARGDEYGFEPDEQISPRVHELIRAADQ